MNHVVLGSYHWHQKENVQKSYVWIRGPSLSFSTVQCIHYPKGFMEDCPDGRMDREKMKIMFAAIMPKVKWNKWTWKEIILRSIFLIYWDEIFLPGRGRWALLGPVVQDLWQGRRRLHRLQGGAVKFNKSTKRIIWKIWISFIRVISR